MATGNGPETALLANASTLPELRGPFPANMTAFLKIDNCNGCHRSLPWEWVPAVLLNGRLLAGTGVWRSQLVGGCCPACMAAREQERHKELRAVALRSQLIELLG